MFFTGCDDFNEIKIKYKNSKVTAGRWRNKDGENEHTDAKTIQIQIQHQEIATPYYVALDGENSIS